IPYYAHVRGHILTIVSSLFMTRHNQTVALTVNAALRQAPSPDSRRRLHGYDLVVRVRLQRQEMLAGSRVELCVSISVVVEVLWCANIPPGPQGGSFQQTRSTHLATWGSAVLSL